MMQNIAEKHGWHKFISMQGFCNLLYREEEREMIPYCHATGVGYLPWSPLAAGVLTHPWHDRSDARERSDFFLKALFRGKEDEADKVVVGRVEEVAKRKGVSMARIATAWLTSQTGLVPICGLDSKERIDEAIEGSNLVLSEEEIKYLGEPYVPKKIAGY